MDSGLIPTRWELKAVALTCAAATVLAACSTSAQKPGPETAGSASSSRSGQISESPSSAAVRPLDAYKDNVPDYFVVDTATDILVAECMTNFGYARPSKKGNLEGQLAAESEARARLFGISDMAAAKKTGIILIQV